MDISVSGNTVTLTGNIKSIQDYQKIKETIDKIVTTEKRIILNIKDSISIISSVAHSDTNQLLIIPYSNLTIEKSIKASAKF